MNTGFRPLGTESQGSLGATLYLDGSASAVDLLDAAGRRTGAVRDLLDALSDCRLEDHQADALSKVARAASLLLGDAEDLQCAARRKMAKDSHNLGAVAPAMATVDK